MKANFRRFIVEIIDLLQDCLPGDKNDIDVAENVDPKTAFHRVGHHCDNYSWEMKNTAQDLASLEDVDDFEMFWLEVLRRKEDGDEFMENLGDLSKAAGKFLVLPTSSNVLKKFVEVVKAGPKLTVSARILLNATLMIRSFFEVST